MFWKFNLLTSNIDTLLDKEDVTLHEILDEDDVLQECKAQNRKLIEFLVQPSNIEELVNLITTEPSDNVDEKTRYNYPNTACELLTSDVCEIYEKLCGEEALMSKVYGFLESEGPLNPLLASFFSKVMGLLINRQSDMIVDFIQSKDDFVGQLLHHIGTSAIMDLLLRLISCISSPEIRRNCINWLNEQNLIQKLVNMIHPSQSEEKHCNASQSLCDIIRLSRQQMAQMQESANSDPLLTAIESQETVTSLLSNMLTGEKNESVLVNGLCVIQTLLEFRKIGPECSDGIETLTQLDQERLDRGINNTLAALVPSLKDIHQLLIEPPKQHYQTMSNSAGVLDPPLGNTRLQVSRLISTLLLLTSRHCINVELANLGTVNCILDLFFKYSWNNFLHTQGEKCISTILLGSQPESEDGTKTESPLLSQLVLDCRLAQRILDAWEDNDVQQARPGGSRKGYMGHLTRIANHFGDAMDKGNNADRLKELFLELPDDVRDKWDNFTSTTLADVNKQNTVDLVGNHLLHSSSEDDDPDFSNIPFPQDAHMQQFVKTNIGAIDKLQENTAKVDVKISPKLAFSDYQLHQMTSNFIDQFGFNEEEFAEQEEQVEAPFMNRISSINFDIPAPEDSSAAASLFEQACNERMQQFDDQNSDEEDLWEEKEITFAQPGRTNPGSAPVAHSEEGSRSDDSDGSTDSEEELDSPAIIRQVPTSVDEKMDIDAVWQGSNSSDADSVPVAMDTGTGWDAVPAAATSTENWANFDGATSSSDKAEENWADFSNFSSINAAPLNSTDPGPPRTASPVAMDTADSNSNPSGRTAAYMVGSAPADLGSEVSSSSSPSSDVQPQADNETDNAASIPETCVSSTTGDMAASSGDIDSQNSNAESAATSTTTTTTSATTMTPDSATRSNDSDSPSNSPPPLPLHGPPSDDPESYFDDDDDDDDDLSANFNFLAASGLMRKSEPKEDEGERPNKRKDDGDADEVSQSTSSASTKIEDARAQAKEALEQFNSMTAKNTQNGPL